MRGRRQKSLSGRADESGAEEGFHSQRQESQVRWGGANALRRLVSRYTLDGFPVTSQTGPDNIFLPLIGPYGPNLSREHHCSTKDTTAITTFPDDDSAYPLFDGVEFGCFHCSLHFFSLE